MPRFRGPPRHSIRRVKRFLHRSQDSEYEQEGSAPGRQVVLSTQTSERLPRIA